MGADIVAVEHAGGFRLYLTFENGERRGVDVADVIEFTGVFAPLREPAYFRSVRVNRDVGTIVWPNGADLCPDVLYERSRPMAPAEP